MGKRKRCRFCWCLFYPNPHVKSRQWSCTKPECQAQRRTETQRRWRTQHPEDALGRRLCAAIAAAKTAGAKVPIGRLPHRGFPWAEVRDELSPQHLVIIGFFLRFVERDAKDQSRANTLEIIDDFVNSLGEVARDPSARGGRGT